MKIVMLLKKLKMPVQYNGELDGVVVGGETLIVEWMHINTLQVHLHLLQNQCRLM